MSTFKPIKIDPVNRAAIVAALQKANGIAAAHTLRSYSTVEQLAGDAEVRLLDLIGPRARAVGAQLRYVSGDSVAKSYRYTRRVTKLVLERRASGWYITSIKCADAYPDGGGDPKLFLTQTQALAAVAQVRKKFNVLEPKDAELPVVDSVDEAIESPGPATDAPEAPDPAEPQGNCGESGTTASPDGDASPLETV